MRKLLVILAVVVIASSCGGTTALKADRYAGMYNEKPRVILIMPPINRTTNVECKEMLYSTMSKPFCEIGYYVISPYLALDVLKAESAYDSELFVDQPLGIFANYFGCDAVVFTEIQEWHKSGIGMYIKTKIRYLVKSAKTNEVLFDRTCDLKLDTSVSAGSSFGGALLGLALSAINTAAVESIEAARSANAYVLGDIPRGPYSPKAGIDSNEPAAPASVSATVR